MNIDFLNPTPEQVEDAKKQDDLPDPGAQGAATAKRSASKGRGGRRGGRRRRHDRGGVAKGSDGRVTSGVGSTGDVAQQGGMSPRTRMMIMAIAPFGLYRIWQG